MSEIVERLAKVLYERRSAEIAADPTAPYRGPFAPFDELMKARQYYLDEAKAIIEALQELNDGT